MKHRPSIALRTAVPATLAAVAVFWLLAAGGHTPGDPVAWAQVSSCGNAILEPGEECDPPGSITCPPGSPADAFLPCNADCTCPAEALDHFQCYELKPGQFANRSATVQDQFGTATVEVRAPRLLCNPTDKNGEGITDITDHLTAHKLKAPRFTKRVNQTVVDQFGTLLLDVKRPDVLLVPTSKDGVQQQPPLDHFQCYKVKRSKGAAKFVKRSVTVANQFETATLELKRPQRLCAPANKNGEDPTAPSHPDHLLCYKTRGGSFGQETHTIANQFVAQSALVIRRQELCVPALKNPGQTTTTTTTTPTTTSSTTTTAPTTSTTSTTGATTTTTTTTTSTTTTTTSPLCGNGIVDPGEECDLSSPSGALLCPPGEECTAACTCEPTTTTSTTIATTTSTSTTTAPTTSTTTSTTTTTTAPTTSTTSTSTSTTTTTTAPPTLLDFATGTPGGTCGTIQDGSSAVIRNLTCGGLNIGGGGSIVPEGPTPDGSISRFALSCVGPNCTIGPTSTAPPVNTAGPDCTNTGCNFGTPLPIPNPAIPSITTCVVNTWAAPASGTLNLSTGASTTNVPLTSDVYLTGNLAQPCPRCSASGTPSSPGTGTCDRGPRAGLACTTTSSTGVTRDCPTGGVGSVGTPCPGPGTPSGCPANNCPCTTGGGNCCDGSHVGPIAVNLSPLGTGTSTDTDPGGIFCPGQTGTGCFGSSACRTITENGVAAGPITTGTPASATLASVFCIAATGNGLVDASANLPGPGAVSLPGTFVVN